MPRVFITDELMQEAINVQAGVMRGTIAGKEAYARSAAADRLIRARMVQDRYDPAEIDRRAQNPRESADLRDLGKMTPAELAALEAELTRDAPRVSLKRLV